MKNRRTSSWRNYILFGILTALAAILCWRLCDLSLLQQKFLDNQGRMRTHRLLEIKAPRGVITDRNGDALAISTKVKSVWVVPQEFNLKQEKIIEFAKLINIDQQALQAKVVASKNSEFLYLKRQLSPDVADKIAALNIKGVYFNTEYRRYYPAGASTAHVLGFTNIDDEGIEGLELAYNSSLAATPGKSQVVRDRLGRTVESLGYISEPKTGTNLQLSLDQRLQYLCYKYLQAAVLKHQAQSGSAVVLDVTTGEVLAMVNQPSYNPNAAFKPTNDESLRNRAVTDYFEPASAMKTFSVASFLEHLPVNAATMINTNPGMLTLKGGVVRDLQNNGVVSLNTVLAKSSNVGVSKLALALPEGALWDTYDRLGFGYTSGSNFPGESKGVLTPAMGSDLELATQAFGYGLAVTPLQLARAYAILGAHGIRRNVSFIKQDKVAPGYRVMRAEVARETVRMLSEAIDNNPSRAKVAGYHVAGKTGTARNLTKDGYTKGSHRTIFAGLAPAINSKFAIVVSIDEPKAGVYYSNQVAAPVFAQIAKTALRLFNIGPDLLESQGVYLAQNTSGHS